VEKRIISVFFILIVLFVSGCNRAETRKEIPNEDAIPFLTFAVNEENRNVEAYLNYWDTEKGKITQIDTPIYVTNKTPYYTNGVPEWDGVVEAFAYPLSWDGESYIYLSSQFHEVKNPLNFKIEMFDDTRDLSNIACSYTKDLQVRLKIENYLKNDSTDFTFTTFHNGKVKKKEVKISLFKGPFHGGIPAGQAYIYDENKDEVKALHLYYDNSGAHFLLCSINLEKGTYSWHEVTGVEGCIPNMGQMDISIIGNSFYVPMCGNGIGMVNLDNYSCKFVIDRDELFRKISSYLFVTPSHILYPYPGIQGEYKDTLILSGMFVFGGKPDEEPTFENYRQVYIAFNIRTSEVIGMLEWNLLSPEFFVVRDGNGKELSRIETDKLVRGISKLQNAGGGLYKNGDFLRSGFIRFPHKNGD